MKRKAMLHGLLGVLLSVILFVSCLKHHEPGELEWETTIGGSGDDVGESVQELVGSGYIIAGYTTSSGAGDADIYLVKLDPNGNTSWTKTYGDSGDDRGYSIQQTSDGGYIIAGYITSFDSVVSNDVYIIKTNSSGDTVWTKRYGGTGTDHGCSIKQTSNGYIVAGYTTSFGAGGEDYYLLKLNTSGDTVWTKTFGGSEDDIAFDVEPTSDDGYIITGKGNYDVFTIKVDANGNEVWSNKCGGGWSDEGRCVKETDDGEYVVAGKNTEMSDFLTLYARTYLVKIDDDGITVWHRNYNAYDSKAYSLDLTSDGGCIIAGRCYENVNLVSTNDKGDCEWTKSYGSGEGIERAHSIQVTSDECFIVAGYTNSLGAGGNDVYVLKIKP